MNTEQKEMVIGIDCDPFYRHQEDFARDIFTNILKQDYREPHSKCFGAWEWHHVSVTSSQRNEIKEYLRARYAEGKIRGALFPWQEDY